MFINGIDKVPFSLKNVSTKKREWYQKFYAMIQKFTT
jgi:hypothetical protein